MHNVFLFVVIVDPRFVRYAEFYMGSIKLETLWHKPPTSGFQRPWTFSDSWELVCSGEECP